MMKAIILAGGFGTRLQEVIRDVPKPMADINGKPFLHYLIHYYTHYVESFILSTGYKSNVIKEYFLNNPIVSFHQEDIPLGTGGAILSTLNEDTSPNESYIIINGDTFLQINLEEFKVFHQENNFDISLALIPMENFDRYGTVNLKGNHIISFYEKQQCNKGLINAGVYIINKNIFDKYSLPNAFSFEEFLENNLHNLKIGGFTINNGYFVDIGIPSDYTKAQNDFKELF